MFARSGQLIIGRQQQAFHRLGQVRTLSIPHWKTLITDQLEALDCGSLIICELIEMRKDRPTKTRTGLAPRA
jgi:hypothetical protein